MDEIEKAENLDNGEEQEPKIYEIGYLLTPIIPQDALAENVVQTLKAPIDKLGGVITSEMDPSMIRLAYTIKKDIGNKKERFNDAYFGALRFKLLPEKAAVLKDVLDKSDKIIRCLTIAMPEGEETIVLPKRTFQRREVQTEPFEIERREKEVEPEEVKEMTKEDIDKEIENLLEEQAS
ncbi:MAG TPA: 30S ribosomal protein S6 [Candidatus Paceibacterota bacterium]|nr:30S ribosomal protein S6 [Candidatus Paceibacterota bacterium]